ncbi:MAG: hypothetical protein OEY85_13320 [Rhodospirillales bacterium]|nr:hypothetical protein [Rhodospirillales bacterium]
MTFSAGLIRSIFIPLAIVLGMLSSANAAEDNRVPLPSPAKAFKGEQCVEPADVMRRNHFEYLLHQRDETMRQGIRGKKYSLRQCVECHAVADSKIAGGTTRTLKPFCGECHAYAAVKIDCFECHSDKAEDDVKKSRQRISPHTDQGKILLSQLPPYFTGSTAPDKGSPLP